jgi:hypothetical protein
VTAGELKLEVSSNDNSLTVIPVFAACESTLGFTSNNHDPNSGLGGVSPPEDGPILKRTTKSY